MKVQIAVTVTPDGRARSVTVLKDPRVRLRASRALVRAPNSLHGGIEREGQPVEQTFTFGVRFTR
jgi:hypothetical protein